MGKRWLVVAIYRTASGPVDVHYEIEDLEEIQDLIERGPDWNSLIEIKITLRRVSHAGLTVEAASAL